MKKIYDLVIKTRRDLHKIPEKSLKEYKTSKYIENFLKKRNIKYEYVSQTGIVSFIKGKNNFKIALRADIDALEITEKTSLKFASEHKGVMHACGHDFHMANLLALVDYYSENTPETDLILIFQPGEEGAGGAKLILKNGLWNVFGKPDVIFGYHVKPDLETGVVAAAKGKAWAGTLSFEITLKGAGGHGANPDKTSDLMMIFSQWYLHVQAFISRKINTFKNVVVTVGEIRGASRLNIITSKLTLKGMLRYFENEEKNFLLTQMEKSIMFFSELYGAKAEFKVLEDAIPLINNSELLTKINDFYKKTYIKKTNEYLPDLKECFPVMLAEDFPEYLRDVKGVFFFLGAMKNTPMELHTPILDLNEEALFYGVNFMITLIKNYDKWLW